MHESIARRRWTPRLAALLLIAAVLCGCAGQQYALDNCIVFRNYAATVNSNIALVGADSTNYFCSCTSTAPPLSGSGLVGNRYEDPLFRHVAAGNY